MDISLRPSGLYRMGLLVLGLTMLVLAVADAAAATTITVCPSGGTYTTIADALAAASNGDKITVGPGTYTSPLTLDISKDVTLYGAGAKRTTIMGDGVHFVQVVGVE